MAKRVVISHFFNEAYLLPWWLKHHREMFDHGVESAAAVIRNRHPTADDGRVHGDATRRQHLR